MRTMSVGDGGKRAVLVVAGGEIVDLRLVDALAASSSYRPVMLATSKQGARIPDCELRQCDTTDAVKVRTAMAGVDVVVNCISGHHRTILATTKAICEAARRNPPRRIVHLSSMMVYGGAEGLVDENTRPEPPLNAYARARIECEALVREYVADGGDAAIIRPACIFGPGSGAWASRIARLLDTRRLGDLGLLGDGFCNLIHVDDLAAMIVAALSAPGVSGETFNACAGWPPPTWNEFLTRFACAIGATPVERITARRMRLEVKVLAPLLRGAAMVAGRVGMRNRMPDAITPSFVRLLRQNITLSGTKGAAAIGTAQRSLDEAINDTAEWWRSHRRLGSAVGGGAPMQPATAGAELPAFPADGSKGGIAAANEAAR